MDATDGLGRGDDADLHAAPLSVAAPSGIIATKMFLLLVAFTLALACPALAWDEPAGFQDVPWGTAIDVVKEKLPAITCTTERCFGPVSIGPTATYVEIGFRRGGMDSAVLSFPRKDFDSLRAVFVEGYGQPTSRTVTVLEPGQNHEILEWSGAKVYVMLSHGFIGYRAVYSDAVLPKVGIAVIRTQAGMEEDTEKTEKTSDGKKDP